MPIELPLSRGLVAIVDDDTPTEITSPKWTLQEAKGTYYANRNDKIGLRKYRKLYLHREILGVTDPSIQVDHINHNGLDNRRENLRICTIQQNNMNCLSRCKSKRFKGVFRSDGRRQWRAAIGFGGKQIHLGVYETEIEAAIAYNTAAVRLHREFAQLNDIDMAVAN